MANYVGKSVARVDAHDKVTGSAVYSVDVDLPGMLFGATLRSPFAHARIIKIETSEAIKVPGVIAVVTGRDFPFIFGTRIKDQPFLAIDRVRYVGEPVVAVAAVTEAVAQEALGKIHVEYEELPAVFDPREAIASGAPILHEGLGEYEGSSLYKAVPGKNICAATNFTLGNIEAGFAESDEIFEDEFYIHAVAHTPMETHAAVAQYFPAGNKFTVWSSTDGPHKRAKEVAAALGIPINHVRFISNYSGGGFGGKGNLVAEAVAIALSRFTQGRPVKIVFSREEELKATQTRTAAFIRLKTGVKRDGTFTARSAEIIWDNGAYASKAPEVARRGALTIFGPYRIPHLKLNSRLVYTNKQIAGAYRGFGTTQATFACEVQMDIIAQKLGMDPLTIRLKNGYVNGGRYINGQVMSAVGLRETLEKSCQAIGWSDQKAGTSGTKLRGKGIAVTIKGTLTPTDSSCFILVNQDASLTLLTSSVEIGGGQKTVLAQIAADTIGVEFSSIVIPNPDTYLTPYDQGVTSSRTTYHMGNAVRMAGQEVRKKILEFAADVLGVDAARLSLSEGKVYEEGAGERITLKALMAKTFGGGGAILGKGYFSTADAPLLSTIPGSSSMFFMFATHAAEVEVDVETGVVKVIRVAAAHDVGRAINPMGCEQQIEGAVVMGLSNSLFEEFKMGKGHVLNASLADYKIATMLDLPEITPIVVETLEEGGPSGARGVGEPAAAPTAPAIANAVFNAVGIRIKELPITPEKVLSALRKKGNKQP
jgi:carbon-monoxide dehydrogenase large subunit